MTSTDPEKRNKLIDELLNRKEFTEIWVQYWAEWLTVRSSNQISCHRCQSGEVALGLMKFNRHIAAFHESVLAQSIVERVQPFCEAVERCRG